MKRIISVLLSITMLFTFVFSLDFNADASEICYGIDISEHNGDFDLQQQKDNGSSFVMIRIGYYTHLDKEFMSNVQKAVEAEMNYGVYLYSYAYNNAEAVEEAEFVINTLNQLSAEYLEYLTMPVAYDLEEAKITQNCTKAQINNQMTTFCDAIKNSGFTPMVYANQNWFNNYIDLELAHNNGYKLWYAYYTDKEPDYSNTPIEIGNTGFSADMWQYTTTNETLDKNIMYSSLKCTEHNYTKFVVKPTCTDKGYTNYTCSECGSFYRSNYKNALGHKWDSGKVINKATVSSNGKIEYHCTNNNCKSTKSTTIYKVSTVNLNYTSLTYNGKNRSVGVTVKDSKGKALTKGTDYTVSWDKTPKNVGVYTCTVKFKGKYTGSKKLTLKVNPAATTLSSVSAQSKALTPKWKKQATQTTGYEIQCATDSKFTKNKKTVTVSNTKTTSKKVTGLKAKTKYYVRVRTYKTVKVNGKSTKLYSGWSKVKTVTTKK